MLCGIVPGPHPAWDGSRMLRQGAQSSCAWRCWGGTTYPCASRSWLGWGQPYSLVVCAGKAAAPWMGSQWFGGPKIWASESTPSLLCKAQLQAVLCPQQSTKLAPVCWEEEIQEQEAEPRNKKSPSSQQGKELPGQQRSSPCLAQTKAPREKQNEVQRGSETTRKQCKS